MNKKKQAQPTISQAEHEQVRSILTHYHQIVTQLHKCTEIQDVETSLSQINNMSADAQIALLKGLAREQNIDAADILAAIYACGALKETRKEAHRSLIRLEGARIYPLWEAPPEPIPVNNSSQASLFPPRFFKGLVTDSYQTGEMELILCWEMGEDYREIRMLVFLLEFWHDGIKDFFTELGSKHGFDNFVPQMAERLGDIPIKECSLDEGIRLLAEAKAANTRYGTKPHRDYTKHLALIKQLIPEDLTRQVTSTTHMPEDLTMQVTSATPIRNWDEDDDEVDLSELAPDEVVAYFIESEADGDLSALYQILSQGSPLREGMPARDWIKRRSEWDERFEPDNLQLTLLATRETLKLRAWRTTASNKQSDDTTKEVEAGWSLELAEILLETEDRLPELPEPVTVYTESKRHWFWASFTLVRENDAWHIQNMTDEYVKARELSVGEIKKRLHELDWSLEKSVRNQSPDDIQRMSKDKQQQYIEAMLLPIERSLYYADTLVRKEPLDRSVYEEAATRAGSFGYYERSLAHLQVLAERFPEDLALSWQTSAQLQQRLAEKYLEEDDDERASFYLDLAEKSCLTALSLEEHTPTRLSLVEILIEKRERLDEAKGYLLQIKDDASVPDVEVRIEIGLGEIALIQEQSELALNHFQRVLELQPAEADNWETLGAIQQTLEHFEEAESSFKRAIELDPHDSEYYSNLGLLYRDMDQDERAIQTLKDGLAANPESVALHLYLAGAYDMLQDYQQAENLLEKAEQLDPGSELVASYRQVIAQNKLKQLSAAQKPLKLTGPKKRKQKHH